MHRVRIGDFEIGGGRLALIAGPCVIESRRHALSMARRLKEIADALETPFVFKASYDKANRTAFDAFRGPGPEEGLDILRDVRESVDVPVLSDIHRPEQAQVAAEALDILQIPAFLCRQTDLLYAAAETGRAVNVKKGPFLAPWDMVAVADKLTRAGAKDILLTERGTSFGYNRLVTDIRSLPVLRSLDRPVVFDATHSVQEPGGLGSASGGRREFVPVLARAAVAAGIDALFLEVHDDPERASCDGPNMLRLSDLPALLETLLSIHAVVRQAHPDTP